MFEALFVPVLCCPTHFELCLLTENRQIEYWKLPFVPQGGLFIGATIETTGTHKILTVSQIRRFVVLTICINVFKEATMCAGLYPRRARQSIAPISAFYR
jgi:hypothetical protein